MNASQISGAIVVPAAGAARRMGGQDKLMMPVGGAPLLAMQLARLRPLGAQIYVALPGPDHPRRDCLEPNDKALYPAGATEGLSGTLRDTIAALPKAPQRVMICLPDLVELETADYRAVWTAPARAPEAVIWRGATQKGAPGHPVLLSREILADFSTLTGDAGAQTVLAAYRAQTYFVPLPGQRARRDLDTPKAWALWYAEQNDQGKL